ncbi:hypothetical protein AK830_g4465 [Neonectria ditissima]|uniref:Right handed beta helix domain-containing protein n=1 Tax=Neonectria ditissima TaxID=78410 RepID=A0A0P7BNB8_9HYPO|nr:hypothetical protein AK830_g4465 [Neonectria ditissima]
MKFTSTLAGLVLLGTVAASPLSSPDDAGLVARTAKCQWKDKQCCAHGKDDCNGDEYKSGSDHYGYRHTIYVKSHKSIQRAIDKASSGDRIVVEAGIYAEQLTIDKDGIELIGKRAVLVPPKKAVKNRCSGLSGPKTEAGICVTGKGVKLAPFAVEHRKVLSVARPVEDVSVTGFEVRKFSGINIAIVGAKNAHITKNKLVDGGKYGSLTAGSYKTLISDNEVSAAALSGSIGVCMDNFSDVLITKNHVSNYGVGLCVQTDGAEVQYNKVKNCCVAVYVDPGVNGVKIRHNYIGQSNPQCPGASGIILDGAVDTKVSDNIIEGQKNKASGIFVSDDECPQTGPSVSLSCLVLKRKAVASDNVIIRNTFRNNDFDVFVNTTAKDNVVKCNHCKTSFPANLCSK